MLYIHRMRRSPFPDAASSARLQRLETGRLAQRAKDVLLASIHADAFPDLLPSEQRLASELGVSRSTVREALRSLEEDGVVTRQRGIGTWVNKHVVRSISLSKAVDFYDLIREAGYEPEIASTEVRQSAPPPEIADRLGLGETQPAQVHVVDRLLLGSGQPMIQVTENIPVAEVVLPFEAVDFPDSVFTFSDTFCRSPIDHTVVEIVPIVASTEITRQLPLKRGEPLLRLVETHYSAEGRPFIISFIHVVHRLLHFTVVCKRM
jgi:GntR family transcriptional regulator